MNIVDLLLANGFLKGRRAVGYARISDDSDEQLSSLKNQIEYFDHFFEEAGFKKVNDCGLYHKRNGAKQVLTGIFADEGISGTSLRNREAFKAMIEDAFVGRFDVIVAKSIQRFARDVENGYPLIKNLAEKGVAVYFLHERISSLDPSADKKISDGLSDAQGESTSKSANVQFGLRLAQKRGIWTSVPSLGYDKVKGRLIRNTYELCLVKEVYYLFYVESYGRSRIKYHMEDLGFLTKSGNQIWDEESLSKMLSNPIYAGLQVQHREKTVDVNRNRRVKLDPSEWITTYHPELAIFSFDEWNLVQMERNKRGGAKEYWQIVVEDGKPRIKVVENKSPSENALKPAVVKHKHSGRHLFSNLLVCGNCGSPHHRRKRVTKKLSYKWACGQNLKHSKKVCGYSNYVVEDELLELVKKEVVAFRSDKKARDWYLGAYIEVKFSGVDVSKLPELGEQRHEIKQRFNDTMNLMSSGKFAAASSLFEERLAEIQAELESVEEQQRAIRNVEKDIAMVKLKFDEFMHFLESVDMDNLTNGVLRRIIDRIYITTNEVKRKRGEVDKEIVISWRFLDTTEGDVDWKKIGLEAEKWEKNVWYRGLTAEEIAEEKENERLRWEWLQSPEGLEYQREQDELAQEILEFELNQDSKVSR